MPPLKRNIMILRKPLQHMLAVVFVTDCENNDSNQKLIIAPSTDKLFLIGGGSGPVGKPGVFTSPRRFMSAWQL